MTQPERRDAFGPLWGKAEATLSQGAYGRPSAHSPHRTNIVHQRNLSRHSSYRGVKDGTMAMGIVEALLALLVGTVRTVSCESDALLGRLSVASLSSATTYQFTWDARDPGALILGGFPADETGKPRPTYHSALCALVQHWAAWQVCSGALGGGDEALERWWGLLTALGSLPLPPPAGGPWPRVLVAQACQVRPANAALRDALEGMADALYLHLRYALPATTTERALLVQCPDAIEASQGYLAPLDPRLLLVVPAAPIALPAAEQSDPDTDLDRGSRGSRQAPPQGPTVSFPVRDASWLVSAAAARCGAWGASQRGCRADARRLPVPGTPRHSCCARGAPRHRPPSVRRHAPGSPEGTADCTIHWRTRGTPSRCALVGASLRETRCAAVS